MTNCAKCGAELIGSRKFCAACGAPTDPSSLKRADPPGGSGPASSPSPAQTPGPQINVPSTAYGPPLPVGSPPVNPFAATASPASRAMGSPYGPPPATTSNPPSGEGTAPVPPVSPLAVSNALSQRGAFQNAAGDRIPPSAPSSSKTGPSQPTPRTGTSPPPPGAAKKAPGTQLMPSMQNPPFGPRSGSSPPAASQAKPPPARTQVMDAASFARPNPNAPGAPIATPSAPSAPVAPVAQPVPPSVVHQPPPPSAFAQPQPPSMGQPHGQPHGHGHGQWGGGGAGGWGTPANAAPPPGYGGFGFAPGARVNVTWSNGQRYPATVSQVSGTQVLVVFPDGQQHWVEMHYLSPA